MVLLSTWEEGLLPKLTRPWTEPYRVMSRIHDNTYRIQLSSLTLPRLANRYHLWRCRGSLPEWWRRQPNTRTNEPESPVDDVPGSFDIFVIPVEKARWYSRQRDEVGPSRNPSDIVTMWNVVCNIIPNVYATTIYLSSQLSCIELN